MPFLAVALVFCGLGCALGGGWLSPSIAWASRWLGCSAKASAGGKRQRRAGAPPDRQGRCVAEGGGHCCSLWLIGVKTVLFVLFSVGLLPESEGDASPLPSMSSLLRPLPRRTTTTGRAAGAALGGRISLLTCESR